MPTLIEQLETVLDALKAGRRHSASDEADMQTIHDLACKQGAKCEMVNAVKSELDELLIYGGAEVKALGDGRIGGYLVRYGNQDEPDLSPKKDWFHSDTYFGARNGDGVDTTLNHTIPMRKELAQFADRMLPAVKTRKDELGLFAETVMNLSDEYEKLIYDLSAAGKLRWSSGAVAHAVKRTRMPNGTNRVDRWIIGEAALTPFAAEPRDTGVMPLKALIDAQQAGRPEPDGSPVLSDELRLEGAFIRTYAETL